MTIGDYLLLPLILLALMIYPLLRKGISLLEILVKKYVHTNPKTETAKEPTTQTLLNLKLLAYERIILFIERMKPDSLIPRTLLSNISGKEYHRLLTNEIRQEYEYNLSQQLYLSENAWNVVTDFKNNIITLINTAAADSDPEKPAGELAKKILEQYIASDIKAGQIIRIIKSEVMQWGQFVDCKFWIVSGKAGSRLKASAHIIYDFWFTIVD